MWNSLRVRYTKVKVFTRSALGCRFSTKLLSYCLSCFIIVVLNGGIPPNSILFHAVWMLRGHGTDRLASESLLISGGNASVINSRPGTTAEVGLGQIPQLFETREQFPHSLAQAHEWPLRFFPIITKLLYSAFKTPLSSCSFFLPLVLSFLRNFHPCHSGNASASSELKPNLYHSRLQGPGQSLRAASGWACMGGLSRGANKPFLLS